MNPKEIELWATFSCLILETEREDIISDKIFDFSYDTMDKLIKKGIDDALEKVFEVEKEKRNSSVDDACNELQKLIEDIKAVNTNGK